MARSSDLSKFETENDELSQYLSDILAKGQAGTKLSAQKAADAQNRQAFDSATNWTQGTLQGAELGMMAGHPAIGAIAGTGLGLARDFKARYDRSGGGVGGFLSSVGNTALDVLNPISVGEKAMDTLSSPGGMAGAARVAGGMMKKSDSLTKGREETDKMILGTDAPGSFNLGAVGPKGPQVSAPGLQVDPAVIDAAGNMSVPLTNDLNKDPLSKGYYKLNPWG
jgi:hypothetical protein